MIHVLAVSPSDAITKMQALCASEAVFNVVLSFPMTLPASNRGFLAAYLEKAKRWQNKNAPLMLEFNHGQYMHEHSDPIKYLANELQRKATSNRAIVSLVSTKQIFGSEDGALPSFMLVQVGFDGKTQETLFLTAYYRALEVTAFLPINVTELALISEQIADRITTISSIDVTIHAFRAHSDPGNTGHEKARLDMATETEIHEWVESENYTEIAGLLREKAAPASIVNVSGLIALREEIVSAGWPAPIRTELDQAVGVLTRLKAIRAAGTHGKRIDEAQNEASTLLRHIAGLVAAKG